MKSFQQFITEAYDKELAGQATRKPGEEGRIRAARKKRDIEKTRMRAAGGGKMVPAKDYKTRGDAGTNKPKSRTQQQPTQARGSAALSPREAQRKAAQERRAAKAGVKTKSADELLSKGNKSQTDPNNPKYKPDPKYKPVKASGLSTKERKALYKKGERTLRDIRLKNLGKKSEKELKFKVTSK